MDEQERIALLEERQKVENLLRTEQAYYMGIKCTISDCSNVIGGFLIRATIVYEDGEAIVITDWPHRFGFNTRLTRKAV